MKEARLLPLVPTDDPGFDAFWLAYPRHDHKFEARKAWAKLKLGPKAQEKLLQALHANMRRPDWVENLRRGRLEFVPLASTWLNNRRFEDETLTSPVAYGPEDLAWVQECEAQHGGHCASQAAHALKMRYPWRPMPPARWYDECAQIHGNACQTRIQHELQKVKDGLGEADA